MFGDVVMGVDHEHFEEAFTRVKSKYKAAADTDVPTEGLMELCDEYKKVLKKHCGKEFPQEPIKQLQMSVEAVFGSWMTPRAVRYREVENIRGLLGTAVNVQSMVYGNMGDDSGTGVGFTRNPSTGENKFFGEFLVNAQGEDVVAGIRTPQPVAEMAKWNKEIYNQILGIKKTLEDHYRDMQDIEFTIERGTLYMLQTRTGKRTGAAAVKVACDMVKEGLIDEKTAVLRIPANDLTQLLLPSFDPKAKAKAEQTGQGAARLAGCRGRQAGVHGRRGGGTGQGGRESAAGPQGNESGRRGRHAQCGRYSDEHRRHDQPRGGRGPRLGTLLRGRRG